ncbi:amidase [Actinocorallia sp. API 0066]|uniref:amidase n=1 Tax=Actinocorallia sp. API 0066 TaxID=2896846 RepID=UPI001E539EE6|nr:amidase [Actinocorallia sp. API 0066]MCD0452805.1 amidase [Actinocorallia sp. API 0066]
MTAIHDLTAREQAAAIRAGELSPVELTEHYLGRIARVDHHVGAFAAVCPDLALDQARKAERQALEAVAPPVLLGVPVPVKDLYTVAGLPTGHGSAARRDPPGAHDGPVAALLRAAGAVVTGKTSTPEFGLTCYTEGGATPCARTPWDVTRLAGGSSGGAAAAVAAGLAPLAQGSDGGGSVRIPASACGLVGMKPSRGVVAVAGDPFGLATSGAIARDVGDAALLLDVLAGRTGGSGGFVEAARRPPGRLRIARTTAAADPVSLDPSCLAAYEKASALLAGLGHEIVEAPPLRTPRLARTFEALWAVLAAAEPVPPAREELLQPLTRWLRDRGRRTTPAEAARLRATLEAEAARILAITDAYDAVLTPTVAEPPVPVGHFAAQPPEVDFARQIAHTPYAALANITGSPSITLPLHWTPDGLPVGVLLTARSAQDALLLSLAAHLESATPPPPRPPLW